MAKKAVFVCLLISVFVFGSHSTIALAQSSNDDLSPKTQQYIDNLNEVKEAQNDGKPVDTSSQTSSQGTSFWKYVFYGFLSGAAYAFWRWLKRLRKGD